MAVYKSKKTTKDNRAWYFSTYYVDLDGINKKKKSKKYNLKKEAEEAERIFLTTYKEQSNNNMTFKDLILDYKNHQKDKVKITTFRQYKAFFDKLKSLENINIDNFNIATYNKWKENISKLKITTISKDSTYKSFRALLNYAVKYHNFIYLTHTLNKMTGFKNPNELKKEMKFWNYEEFKFFIEQEKELKYKCFFEILYYCGLRKGEANALNWNDIDFKKATVTINKNVTLKIKGHKYIVLPPKTKSSYRTLPLPKHLLNNLKSLKNEYEKYSNYNNNWFVCGGINPLADSTVNKRKKQHIESASLPYIRLHDFRHSCASLLINNNASIMLVSKYLGHSNITTTLNTYAHMFKNEYDDIIKVINELN